MTGCNRARRTPLFFSLLTKGVLTTCFASQFLLSTADPMAAMQVSPNANQSSGTSITYTDGQLSIRTAEMTLAEVLAKVSSLTGVKIELPDDVNMNSKLSLQLGPGPVRQILASLLSDSDLDYMIQASDANPNQLHAVLIMSQKKKGENAAGELLASRATHSPYVRTAEPAAVEPEATPASSEAPTTATPEPASATDQNAPAPVTQPDQAAEVPASQRNPSQAPATAPLSPPATLNPQSINQQLQQMYQQRMQMVQQDRQKVQPAAQQ